MDFRQLRYLVRIVELQSFASAADSLHIAPSALGVQVRNLEEELGVQLLLRHARGVSPTAAGLDLVDNARRILATVEQAAHSARSAGMTADTEGHVSIGLTPPINDFLSMSLLKAVKHHHPRLRTAIMEAPGLSLGSLVQAGELDMACAYDVTLHADLQAESLMEDEFVFFQHSDSDSGSGPITLAAAARHPLVLPAPSHGSRVVLGKEAQRRSIVLDVPYEVQSLAAVRELVLGGQAAAIVPFASVVRHIADERVRIRPLVEPRIVRPLWLIRSRQARCGSELLDAVASIFTDLLLREVTKAHGVLDERILRGC